MLQQDNVDEFIETILKEIDDYEHLNQWTLINRSALPPDAKNIMPICSYKYKCFPHGRLMKHKDRLCAHSSIQ